MDGGGPPLADGCVGAAAASAIVKRAHAPCVDAAAAAERLRAGLGAGPFAAIAIFTSPEGDLEAMGAALAGAYPGAALIGCTTAGEISPDGYTVGEVVAVALPADVFSVLVTVIDNLSAFDASALAADLMSARSELAQERPEWAEEFAFLMVDGLSLAEDPLSAALSAALGPAPFFGGSAGDGLAFRRTRVLAGGVARSDAAVVALVRTACRVKTFRLDHLRPTDARMVVTGADPARRVVTEINAEPAAREYARILGKDPEQLSPFIFAAHPVLVRIGGEHFVRAIQQVTPEGEMIFFSAIDEGLVLTLAEADDIAAHLDGALGELAAAEAPDAIIACDCILRRLEAEETQSTRAVSSILARNRVVGFSSYGEQSNGAHLNQTMTGVAVYPPLKV